jgi:malate dehydrogenase
MSIVSIVGAGQLGGMLAFTLATNERVREIRLIDTTEAIASGTALDIQQAGAVERFDTTVVSYRELPAVIGSDIVILTGPAKRPATEWSDDDGLEILQQLGHLNRRALIVCAGSGHRQLIERGAAETSLSGNRVVGSGPYALQNALKTLVALELQCSALDVSLAVLGAPPAKLVIPWSGASVQGVQLSELLSQKTLELIQEKVVRRWPLGPYALAAAAARLCEIVLQETSTYGINCYAVLNEESHLPGRVAAVTASIDRSGIKQIVPPVLNIREQVALDNALLKR